MRQNCSIQSITLPAGGRISIMQTLLSVLIVSCLSIPTLHAASAVERSNQIKEWRSNCTDPDSDMRLAWLESAIESEDLIAQRTCAKVALFDTDIEMRRLGVQMAIAINDRLIVKIDASEEYRNAMKSAGTDKKKIREVKSDFGYTAKAYETLGGAMTLAAKSVSLMTQTSEWLVVPVTGVESDSYKMSLTLIGDGLSGVGTALTPAGALSVTLNVELNDAGILSGTIGFYGGLLFPATIQLL